MDEQTSTNIHASGGLLSSEFVQSARVDASANELFAPESFTDPQGRPMTKKGLEEHLTSAWSDFCERFDEVRLSLGKWEAEEARRRWTLPILGRILGFDPKFVPGSDRAKEGQRIPPKTSHRGWVDPGAPPVHIVPPNQELDARIGVGRGDRAPHDLLQQVLNTSGRASWGVVTNGRALRILRTYHHTYTRGHVEFDLESIFAERNFSDFRALLRLAHSSRFRPTPGGDTSLEKFYKQSVAAGIRAGEDLRSNVKGAIEALGTGLLASNPGVADELSRNPIMCKTYYQELLRVVYRILFLLYAEQRAMLPTRDSVYAEEYSLMRLRRRAEEPVWSRDENQDIWQGLLTTFQLLKEGCSELKVYPYNGPLFDNELLPTVSSLNCSNRDLLRAIRSMTLIEREAMLQRISYLDVGVEEIGAIYESLLDFTPRVLGKAEVVDDVPRQAREFVLDPAGGSRKTTGSYYTNPALVDALVRSALAPTAERALAEAGSSKEARERALLALKVCDPACGSGAFLIAAANYLGGLLVSVRAETETLDSKDSESRRARRDVLQNCIYAVDVNPMAVELAKVALWIDSAVEDLPLNFLDHRIKTGNSLLGMTPELAGKPVPSDAFQPTSMDDREVSRRVRRQASREEKQTTLEEHGESVVTKRAEAMASLASRPELTVEGVEAKRRAYADLQGSAEWMRAKLAADAWTSAFFWPLDESAPPAPTESILRRLGAGTQVESVDPRTLRMAEAIAEENRFFHGHLEFPDVFYRERPGFDCVLGNPPWERIKLQEKEFFEGKDADIVQASTTARRRQLIADLPRTHPELWTEYAHALRQSEGQSKFLRSSRRFPLTSAGDINTYSVFAETCSSMTADGGRTGIIVPTGIATDQTNAEFFGKLVDGGRVVSLIDFENREGLFDSVDRRYKFCLLTLGARMPGEEARFAFFLSNPAQMDEDDRVFTLTQEDFQLLNPNTRTCPLFRSRRDAELTRGIHRRIPVLINHRTGSNPWGVRFTRMIDMSNDSGLFRTKGELEGKGFRLEGNVFVNGSEVYLPLYEAKMIWQFDHRYGSFEGKDDASTSLPFTPTESYRDPGFVVQPRYWLSEQKVVAASGKLAIDSAGNGNQDSGFTTAGRPPAWLLGFRDIARATDERSFVSTVFPFSAVGNSLPLMSSSRSPAEVLCLLANLNSFALDYCARQKAGGVHMNFFLVEQFPILPPSAYTSELANRLKEVVWELVYTSSDMGPLAVELGYTDGEQGPGPPFIWDEERRFHLRCELDAIYFHLYGFSRDDVDYVMETFPIVKRKDVEKHGIYRTKEVILAEYDKRQGKVTPYDIAQDETLKSKTTFQDRREEVGAP